MIIIPSIYERKEKKLKEYLIAVEIIVRAKSNSEAEDIANNLGTRKIIQSKVLNSPLLISESEEENKEIEEKEN